MFAVLDNFSSVWSVDFLTADQSCNWWLWAVNGALSYTTGLMPIRWITYYLLILITSVITSVMTLAENDSVVHVMENMVLTRHTYHCCLNHRYRAGRQHFSSLLTLTPFLHSSRTVRAALSSLSGAHECDLSGRLWEGKAGAPWSWRWQCFSSEVSGPSQHRTQHLFSH